MGANSDLFSFEIEYPLNSVVVMEMPGGTDRRRSLVKRAFSDGKSKRKGPKPIPHN